MKTDKLLQYLSPTQLDVLYSMVGTATPEMTRSQVLSHISEYKYALCGQAAVYLDASQVAINSLIDQEPSSCK